MFRDDAAAAAAVVVAGQDQMAKEVDTGGWHEAALADKK